MKSRVSCKLCTADTEFVGYKFGSFEKQKFFFYHCHQCGFVFIENPCKNYNKIYSKEYYSGKGADPLADYIYEIKNYEKTIRQYEWPGIFKVVSSLKVINSETRWLDYGCGNGGLVHFGINQAKINIIGFEEGWIKDWDHERKIPLLDKKQMGSLESSFDVITAIEVLEHLEDPLETLKIIRKLLKPNGLFFFTTGNLKPFIQNILKWKYASVPEVHISFFQPETLEFALKKTGFSPEFRGFIPGFEDIIRFKILKNLGLKRKNIFESFLPWNLITKFIDNRYKVTAHPIAWA